MSATEYAPVLDLDRLRRDLPELRRRYAHAEPFPHIVFEDLLLPGVVDRAAAEFPALDPDHWTNYVHANERKFSNTDPSTWGPTLQAILATFNSPEFVAFVGELIGVEDLFADHELEGGGLHQSTTGGYLNVHADFTVHPHHRSWQRRANLLLYLNDGWKPEYGGDLELWSRDMKERVATVSPIANRVLIFTTDETSFHGHPEPMRCPPDVARRSLALYYFTEEADPVVRSTEYRARPGDGIKSLAIYADKQILRIYDRVKRRLGLSDETASKLLGWNERLRRRPPKP